MGDLRKHMGTWLVWGSEARGDLLGMGCSVWPARCEIVDFADFYEFMESGRCAWGGGRPSGCMWIWKMWLSRYGLRTLRLLGKKCGRHGDVKAYKRRSIQPDYPWRG